MTCGARAPSNQLAGWGAARHHCGAGHESRINPNNLRQVRGSIFSLLLVWFADDMKSERPACICSIFFCSLFVNLLCRKPEIEPLGFTCN